MSAALQATAQLVSREMAYIGVAVLLPILRSLMPWYWQRLSSWNVGSIFISALWHTYHCEWLMKFLNISAILAVDGKFISSRFRHMQCMHTHVSILRWCGVHRLYAVSPVESEKAETLCVVRCLHVESGFTVSERISSCTASASQLENWSGH